MVGLKEGRAVDLAINGMYPGHTLLIVDDHAVFREGLRRIIEQQKDLTVCGEAANADAALPLIESLKPHLVILDISMDGMSALELIKTIRHKYSRLPILVLSMHKEYLYAERVLRAGANGYIMKQEDSTKVLAAIRYVLEGKTYVSESLTQQLLRGLTLGKNNSNTSSLELLSTREFEVFRLIAQGHGTRQIADSLQISIKTAETHREHIRAKLSLKTSFELIQFARTWGANEKVL